MAQTPIEIMESAYHKATNQALDTLLSVLSNEIVKNLKIIVEQAETQKAVLGVTITSLVYKVFEPSQDIRKHQESMNGGYSGRSFDNKYVTPFMKQKFPHLAMAESAWLTRSLEQPHPYDFSYPGKIRNKNLKSAFLYTLDYVEKNGKLAYDILVALIGLLIESSANDSILFDTIEIPSGLTIAKIIEAVNQHICYHYGLGVVGTARIPVLAIYSVYKLLMSDVKRYSDKTLAPLGFHTSSDFRSKSLGDIDVNNADGTCFESIEIKHNKPISVDMIGVAYRKINNTNADRYYILTTSDPNFNNQDNVMKEIEKYKKLHSCQIIVNGVIPSLKYYMRLISNPQAFIDEYTRCLEFEFQRAGGVKREHLRVWNEIRQTVLKIE